MQLTVVSSSKDSRQAQGKTYWGIKHTDGAWYNLVQDEKPIWKSVIDCDVKDSNYNGKVYHWATPTPTGKQSTGANGSPPSGAIPWTDWVRISTLASELAELNVRKLAEDEPGDILIARSARVNTILIAFGDGKIALPPADSEESPPPPNDDDIPF